MRGKIAAWLRTIVVLAALAVFGLAWFDALPDQVPQVWRTPIALIAAAAVVAAGLNLLLSTVRSAKGTR